MARVIWTPEAFRQLDAIREYMLEAAPGFAGALLVGILAAMEPAGRFPRMGRMVPEFPTAGRARDHLRQLSDRLRD